MDTENSKDLQKARHENMGMLQPLANVFEYITVLSHSNVLMHKQMGMYMDVLSSLGLLMLWC